MKKIFTLLTLIIVSALSMSLSAQSIVGKWNAVNNITKATYESMGATVEKCTSVMTFNEDGTNYTEGEIIISVPVAADITMRMVANASEKGEWKIEGDQITIASLDIEVDGGVSFSDPMLDAQADSIWESMQQQMTMAEGTTSTYDLVFHSENLATMTLTVEDTTLIYTLSRIE